MKKAFDQTVRDIKREVNKKVLKVPSIEQKVLDATSNEPWGPHGSLLADIAQATRNYHEYQMIMSIIWKRINDTGKNWRHVYKALTVLEYLVAHGSDRVIDEIREHAYQISTLSDFQYIDSSGRDQGNNVRKKSQSLVVLVNDKERIQEVRQKAAANRDKYRNTSMGNMYRPGSYSSGGGYGDRFDEDRYGSRDDDHNAYGREREGGQRDDDRYGRYGDSYGRDGDRYNREYEERSGRGGYRDDDYRGRSRSIDNYQYGSRSRSADRDRDRAYEDDGQYSSRGSGAKADDHSQDGSTMGRPFDRKYSEQHLNTPPSYEEAVNGARSPTYSERDGEPSQASAPKASHPPSSASPSNATAAAAAASPPQPLTSSSAPAPAPDNKKVDGFDEFDPRGLAAPTMPNVAAPTTSGGTEMDLLDSLALVPVTQITTSEADASVNSSHGPANLATPSQPFDDPFGDGPFKAVTSTNSVPAQQQIITSTSSFHPSSSQNSGPPRPIPQNTTTEFGGTQSPQQELSTLNQDFDILADILPPSGASLPVNLQTGYPVPVSQPALQSGFASQPGQPSLQTSYPLQPGQSVPMAPTFPALAGQASQTGFPTQSGQPTSLAGFPSQMGSSQVGIKTPDIGQSAGSNANFYGGQYSNAHGSQSVLPASTMSTAIVPQPSKDKFETKSTVWTDTLSRGLVDLNISGTKTNPLADIGVDFEAINRKERRMEKPTASTATSNVTMGKAMGSGSGIGRAGAGSLRHPSNPMMGSGMGIGTTGQPGVGIGMGGYGVNPQPMGNMGMGMNMGMGQGVHMQQQTGFPPVTRPGGYNNNPMTGTGNFNQQPYGGGY